MNLVFWILLGLVAAALALFAGSNREAVSLHLWPLPFALDLPLYLALCLALLSGFVVGVVSAFVGGRSRRREARRRARRLAAIERELAATQRRLPDATPPRPIATRG